MKICVDVRNCLQNLADIRWRQGYPFRKKMWKNSAEKSMKTVRLRWRKSARIFTLTWPCRWDMRVRNWAHQFALLEPFGKDNPSPLFADRNLSISRMWVIGKNRNVLRMSVLSEYGQPVPVIFFGDVETLFAYFTEKFGQEEVENALHGRKNRILFSMVYTAKIDFYQGNENLQLEMKYYR